MKRPRKIRPYNRVRPQMTEEDQRKQQFISPSKHKLNPYLMMHFGKTEKFTAGDPVEPWSDPLDPNDPCAFTRYMESLGISYWWKMDGTYTAVGQSEANQGVGGTMPLYARGSVTSLSSNQPALPKKTCDGKSITKGNYLNYSEAGVLVTGTDNFTIGGWFKTTGIFSDTGIFKTNAGFGGYRSGIHVRPLNMVGTTGYLTVSPSRGVAGTNKVYTSPLGSYLVNTVNFVVLRVRPTTSTTTLQFDLFINGVKQTLTDTGNPDHSINWNTTYSFENPGVYYSSGDGQSNGSAYGGYDELFFHWGLLTDQQILELYTRGS